jgi:hypothetical protein
LAGNVDYLGHLANPFGATMVESREGEEGPMKTVVVSSHPFPMLGERSHMQGERWEMAYHKHRHLGIKYQRLDAYGCTPELTRTLHV